MLAGPGSNDLRGVSHTPAGQYTILLDRFPSTQFILVTTTRFRFLYPRHPLIIHTHHLWSIILRSRILFTTDAYSVFSTYGHPRLIRLSVLRSLFQPTCIDIIPIYTTHGWWYPVQPRPHLYSLTGIVLSRHVRQSSPHNVVHIIIIYVARSLQDVDGSVLTSVPQTERFHRVPRFQAFYGRFVRTVIAAKAQGVHTAWDRDIYYERDSPEGFYTRV